MFLSTTFYLQNAISLDFQQFQNAINKPDEFSFLNTINVIKLDHITTAGGLSFRVNHLFLDLSKFVILTKVLKYLVIPRL